METGVGGFELEQSLFDTNDRDGESNIQANNITGFVPLDQLVDEDGNNFVLDSSFPGKQLDYFTIEEGTDNGGDGFLVEEDTTNWRYSFMKA